MYCLQIETYVVKLSKHVGMPNTRFRMVVTSGKEEREMEFGEHAQGPSTLS